MIVVRVREQDDVDVAEPRVGLINGEPGIVQNASAGRILEQNGAVSRTELALVAAERRRAQGCLGAGDGRLPGKISARKL